jgi:hypothetical protein
MGAGKHCQVRSDAVIRTPSNVTDPAEALTSSRFAGSCTQVGTNVPEHLPSVSLEWWPRAIVVIDEVSPEHPYLQAGEIVSRLPSLTELTGQTGLAVGTVRRAIDVLAREHLMRIVPGRGTFVIAARR